MAGFEPPTQNQIFFLKRLSSTDGSFALGEKDLEKLSKDKASKLIGSMLRNGRKGKGNGNGNGNGNGDGNGVSQKADAGAQEKPEPFGLYSTNYKAANGAWQVARMTAEEEESLRKMHAEHCRQVLKECLLEFQDKDVAIAVFSSRCDKFFSWVQAFLDDKVRLSRNGNGGEKNASSQ